MANKKTKAIKSIGLSKWALLTLFREVLARTFQAFFATTITLPIAASLTGIGFFTAIQAVLLIMALLTKGNAVADFIAESGICRPVFNMMRGQLAASHKALSASVVVALENIYPPFFVSIPGHLALALTAPAFVSRMTFRTLKMRRGLPSIRLGSRLNASHCLFSGIGISPLLNRALFSLFGSIWIIIGAIPRTVRGLRAKRTAKFNSAGYAIERMFGLPARFRAELHFDGGTATDRFPLKGYSASLAGEC